MDGWVARIGSVVTLRCGFTRTDPTLQWIETVMTKPFLQLAAVGVAGVGHRTIREGVF